MCSKQRRKTSFPHVSTGKRKCFRFCLEFDIVLFHRSSQKPFFKATKQYHTMKVLLSTRMLLDWNFIRLDACVCVRVCIMNSTKVKIFQLYFTHLRKGLSRHYSFFGNDMTDLNVIFFGKKKHMPINFTRY